MDTHYWPVLMTGDPKDPKWFLNFSKQYRICPYKSTDVSLTPKDSEVKRVEGEVYFSSIPL